MMLVRAFMLTAQHSIIGTSDINAYLEEAPGLPATIETAAKRAYGANPLQPDPTVMDKFYKPFEDKVERRIKDYQAFAQQKMGQSNAKEADYREQAEANADSHPIVANMGGYDKVSKMSEAEAKTAANKAAAQYMTDPFAANGVQSAGMKALYQKIISDPAYAKKFEKMSEAEKEAELRKYMANDTPVVKSPVEMEQDHRKFENQQVHANRVRHAQAVQLKISELQQKLTEVAQAFGQKRNEIAVAGRSHDAISKDINKRYEAIPMVELGEYGHDHDPAQVRPLRIEEAKLHRERATQELKQYTTALAEVADRYQLVVSEYLDFVKQNSQQIYGGTSPKDMMEGINTEQPLLSFEAGLLGLAFELSQYSRQLTSEIAQWEANYLQVLQAYK